MIPVDDDDDQDSAGFQPPFLGGWPRPYCNGHNDRSRVLQPNSNMMIVLVKSWWAPLAKVACVIWLTIPRQLVASLIPCLSPCEIPCKPVLSSFSLSCRYYTQLMPDGVSTVGSAGISLQAPIWRVRFLFSPNFFFSFLSSLHFVPWANIDLSESAASHELVMHYDDLTAAYESHLESKHRQRRPSLRAIGNDG